MRVEEFKHWIDSDEAMFAPSFAIKYKKSPRGKQMDYHHFLGRQGIVCFRNFWGSGNNGDHIDLWNGSEVAHGGRDYFERSQEIWFWDIP